MGLGIYLRVRGQFGFASRGGSRRDRAAYDQPINRDLQSLKNGSPPPLVQLHPVRRSPTAGSNSNSRRTAPSISLRSRAPSPPTPFKNLFLNVGSDSFRV